MKLPEAEFEEGAFVRLKTGDGTIRQVCGYLVKQGTIEYGLSLGENETYHAGYLIERAKKPKDLKINGFHNEGTDN